MHPSRLPPSPAWQRRLSEIALAFTLQSKLSEAAGTNLQPYSHPSAFKLNCQLVNFSEVIPVIHKSTSWKNATDSIVRYIDAKADMLHDAVVLRELGAELIKNLQHKKSAEVLEQYGKRIQEAINAAGRGGSGSSNANGGPNGQINWERVIRFLKEAARKLLEQLEWIENFGNKLKENKHKELLEKMSRVCSATPALS